MISGEPSDFPEMILNNTFVLNRWPAFARARLFEQVIEFFEQISLHAVFYVSGDQLTMVISISNDQSGVCVESDVMS